MTNKEAIEIFGKIEVLGCGYCYQGGEEFREALDLAIASLKGENKTHTCTSCRFFTPADEVYGRCDKKDAYDSFTRARRQRACKMYQNKKEALEANTNIEEPFITGCRELAIKKNLPLYFVYYEKIGILEVYISKTKELFEKRHCSKYLSTYALNEIVTDYLDWYSTNWAEADNETN